MGVKKNSASASNVLVIKTIIYLYGAIKAYRGIFFYVWILPICIISVVYIVLLIRPYYYLFIILAILLDIIGTNILDKIGFTNNLETTVNPSP